MKNLQFVIFVIFVVCGGSLARIISVITTPQEPSLISKDETNENQGLVRAKRQFGFGPFGQSSAQANANAFNQQFGPHGFGSSASNAAAQSFNSQGPFGGFGASAANSQSQGFNCGYSGCSGSLGFSGSQSYNLPGGRKFAFSLGRGVSFVPGQAPSVSNSDSFSFTK
ncbi:uncharacterized protein [Chironomus tepperi]|uniref:uncharacterized protein n=1 Tax=Chironomus tepperi TaxID=113505 RepID=UPI00391F7A69